MTNEIIISGFGGQGVMAIGKTLCEAGMKEGKNVSWLPSYGPEMRGGTANCCVVLSDEPIVSPIVLEPTELIAMNLLVHMFTGPKAKLVDLNIEALKRGAACVG